jgi:Ca2+-binding RTX toxin-like protein
MDGYDADSEYSFSLTSTTATWTVNDNYRLTIVGTDLDTNHGKITAIYSDTWGSIKGIRGADFNLFRAGMDEQDWGKIGAALKGIDLNGSANWDYNYFQGFGGDDDIKLANHAFYADYLYFDGGNDHVNLGTGSDFVYASSVNYIPDYETLRWEVDGGGGLNSLYLWQDPSTSSKGYQILNATTKGFDITLGKESEFLDGTALFKHFSAVYGTPFADRVTGDADWNTLHGEGGADNLNGAGGNDTLYGGNGNDSIIGGKGKDELYGEAGADTFILNAAAGSTVDIANRDTIHDFKRADHDEIDLHLMDANSKKQGNQAFDFIGTQSFHHQAGELRYVQKGGDTFVYGDVNGDGKADFALALDGKIGFHAGDFNL